MREILTTLSPRQLHLLSGLHNSIIFSSKDKQVQKIITGFGNGVYREIKSEGLEDAAGDILFEARAEKKQELK